MNTYRFPRAVLLLIVTASFLAVPALRSVAQDMTDPFAALRSDLLRDREEIVAEAMQLTETEGAAFWPLYDEYRSKMGEIGDGLIKLVLEYSDVYPNVSEDRAAQLFKDYLDLEKKLASERTWYFKKFARLLPATKTLRFAQVENRLDLALRLQLASAIPLSPIEGQLMISGELTTETIQGVPGGIAVQTEELTATVVAIDSSARELTLLGRDGIKQTVQVGPDAVNFDQIRVGDRLKIVLARQLVIHLAGENEPSGDAELEAVALAPKGARPAGIVAQVTQVTAQVTAIDASHHQVTLKFEDGTTKTVDVRPDVNLGLRKVGEKVVIRTTEALALSVEKQ